MNPYGLTELPETFAGSRAGLHQLAFFALAPTRYRAVGRMGLRYLDEGFGTPEFEGRVVGVQGDELLDRRAGLVRSQAISTVREACEFLGHPYEVEWFGEFYDPLDPIDPDAKLEVDPAATRAIGSWYKFAWDLLGRLQIEAVEGDDPSEIQMWPEHFDAATELGDHQLGQRASFGASPGDSNHEEPYLYVAAWSAIDRSNPYWNDETFNGSSLSYRELMDADDSMARGLEFLLGGHRALHSA